MTASRAFRQQAGLLEMDSSSTTCPVYQRSRGAVMSVALAWLMCLAARPGVRAIGPQLRDAFLQPLVRAEEQFVPHLVAVHGARSFASFLSMTLPLAGRHLNRRLQDALSRPRPGDPALRERVPYP
jgi:hypothetical protein